jgi:hypothetical protein
LHVEELGAGAVVGGEHGVAVVAGPDVVVVAEVKWGRASGSPPSKRVMRFCPVICSGGSIPRWPRMVGATSWVEAK